MIVADHRHSSRRWPDRSWHPADRGLSAILAMRKDRGPGGDRKDLPFFPAALTLARIWEHFGELERAAGFAKVGLSMVGPAVALKRDLKRISEL